MLRDVQAIEQFPAFKVSLGFGQAQTATGKVLSAATADSAREVDYAAAMPKAPYRRALVDEQLYSGHLRLDLGRPMAKGNFIVFKGPSKKGKTEVAFDTISQFLAESPSHKAIYVSLAPQGSQRMLESLPNWLRGRAMAIGVESAERGDADFLLAPMAAIRAAAGEAKVLVVFDDVLLHRFKEQLVYDLAGQPFGPENAVNHLQAQTGNFADGRTVTTIVIADTEGSTLQFQKDEQATLAHLESVAD